MVDLGVILSENIIKHIDEAPPEQKLITTVYNGASEVSTAILTAVSTTIVSFIPVFTMQAAEGKLFGPLAFTKTFALIAALLVSLLIMPTLAHWFFGFKIKNNILKKYGSYALIIIGITSLLLSQIWGGVLLILFGTIGVLKKLLDEKSQNFPKALLFLYRYAELIIVLIGVTWLLAKYWLPLGASKSLLLNFVFVTLLVGLILGSFTLLENQYQRILRWCLNNKVKFLLIPAILILLAANIWLGFSSVFGFVSKGFEAVGWNINKSKAWSELAHTFPGIGKEFMPSLDEGSFLLMPTSMPHSGVAYNRKVIGQLDMLLTSIPEVELTVGKLGRVESALDPAPISMYENIINYKPEYILNEKGHRQRFKVTKNKRFISVSGDTLSNQEGLELNIGTRNLIPDNNGEYYRNWREEIKSPDDIWNEIVKVTKIPGVTSAPKLQPIETRLVMLQTGMRAPMGIKVYGPDLKTIENFGLQLENILKEVPSVKKEAVFADRIVGKTLSAPKYQP